MRIWKLALGFVVAVVATGVLYTLDHHESGLAPGPAGAATPNPAMMAMPVPVTKVVRKTLPIYLEYSARIESIGNVALQAKVSGYLKEQLAPDGADVKQGDLLYKIDPRDFQASLDLAKAQAERDEASLEYMRSNFNRGTELAKTGNIAKDAVDQRGSNMRMAEAAVSMDQAAIRTALLNLGYAEIRAPFAGRLGRNQAPIGTLIGAGGAALNNLVQLDPIYVTFNPSESDLAELETRARRARSRRTFSCRARRSLRARANSRSSTIWSIARPAPSRPARRSAIAISSFCRASTSASSCTSRNSPMR